MFLFSKKNLLFLVLFMAILRGDAQDSLRMSLDDAVNYAMKNSNSIKNTQTGVRDAELLIKENLATGLPQVNGELGYNYFYLVPKVIFPDFFTPAVTGILSGNNVKNSATNEVIKPQAPGAGSKTSFQQKNTLSAGITASQLIYSGSYNVALKASRLARQLANVQLTAKQAEVRNQVMDAYLPGLLITESLKTLDKNIENLEKLLKEVKATYKAGFVEQLDVDRLELSLANLQSERDNIDRQQGLVLNALKMVIGYPMDKGLELMDNINSLMIPAPNEDLVGQIDFSKRAEYAVLNTVEQLNGLNVELQKATAYPTIASFASFTENLQTDNFFSKPVSSLPTGVVGFSAKINIWDSNIRKTKVERAKIALEQLKYQKSDFERAVTLQVLNARIAYTNAQRRLESQKKNEALAERIHTTTQTKYKNGIGSSLEITTAEQQLYQSQQNVRQAQFDLLSAQKGLQKALGK